ncbi:hypothetical protein NQZ68_003718 [Dissostichus eleginoides]|nr:hypothetical protein NQZ68_003718 [Dissostichus eleginoides]
MVEAVALNPAADGSNAEKDTPPADMLRMNQQMSNQCLRWPYSSKQESKDLQDEVTEAQKKRLEIKQLLHEKMKEMEDLKSKKEHEVTEKFKAALEKGQGNLEKYKKMSVMTQNVLRGIILACKINWMDDPKLRDIAMMLEDLPFSD